MKYPIQFYARALAEILEHPGAKAREEKIIENFTALLRKNGDFSRAKQILERTEENLLRKEGKKKIVVESARPLRNELKALIRTITEEGDKIKETLNEDLIAGVKITVNNETELDYSLARKLQKLFT